MKLQNDEQDFGRTDQRPTLGRAPYLEPTSWQKPGATQRTSYQPGPTTEAFKVKDARSTVDPLMQILEKLSATEHHLTNLTAKANQQEEHLTAISAKANQQQEHLAAQQQQFAELRQAHH